MFKGKMKVMKTTPMILCNVTTSSATSSFVIVLAKRPLVAEIVQNMFLMKCNNISLGLWINLFVLFYLCIYFGVE